MAELVREGGMNISLKAAIALYCLVGLLMLLGGANYVLRSEYLPYHEEVTQAAFWMLPLLALTFLAILNYSTYYMNSTTPGGPPLQVGGSLVVIVSLAAVLSYLGRALKPNT